LAGLIKVMKKQDAGKERRGDIRAKLDLRVAYGTAFDVTTTAYMQDIGHGGVFVRTENPLEIGAHLDLEFTLPEKFRTIKAQATVAWSRKTEEGDLFPAGMGLEFTQIQPVDQKSLYDYVKKLVIESPDGTPE
jgi:uncharacterized protein (TIGR02266 family)